MKLATFVCLHLVGSAAAAVIATTPAVKPVVTTTTTKPVVTTTAVRPVVTTTAVRPVVTTTAVRPVVTTTTTTVKPVATTAAIKPLATTAGVKPVTTTAGSLLGGLGSALGGLGTTLGGVLSPILTPLTQNLVPNTYIVKLKDGTPLASLQNLLNTLTGQVLHIYDSDNFKGFTIQMDAKTMSLLQSLNIVDFIEQDAISSSSRYVAQPNAPSWGLARISSKNNKNTTYTYDDTAGAGTCSYVIDSGIYTAHSDFGGRATWLNNFVDKNNTDGAGHGTHIAGTIGGTQYGVAKKTKLFAVKVLDASGVGPNSGIIAGMNFVINDAKSRASSCPAGSVVNVSIGGAVSAAVNAAAKAMVDAGLFVGVSAGNDNRDASNQSPAVEPSVCTVGATTSDDQKASFSNFGSVVDILAPGNYITSAGIAGPTAWYIMSGTSMATPHVVGLAAYLLTLKGKQTPAVLCNNIKTLANKNAIKGFNAETVNQLAFNGNPSG